MGNGAQETSDEDEVMCGSSLGLRKQARRVKSRSMKFCENKLKIAFKTLENNPNVSDEI